jgi:hypothetical protein
VVRLVPSAPLKILPRYMALRSVVAPVYWSIGNLYAHPIDHCASATNQVPTSNAIPVRKPIMLRPHDLGSIPTA